MLAIGVDLIEVERVQRSLDRFGEKFLNRIFTLREQQTCAGQAERLAARFAVKEAVGKALGTGIGDVCWQEIEVLNEPNGRPILHLHGSARDLARSLGLVQWQVSMAHTKGQAVGMVVAVGASATSAPV